MNRLAVLFCLLLGTTQLTCTEDNASKSITTPSSSEKISIVSLVQKIQNSIDVIKKTQNPDEIISPEIKKDTLQNISLIANNLDIVLPTLPQSDQQKWRHSIQNLIDPAQQNIRTLMMDIMKDEWNHRGKEVVQLAIGMARAAMTSAAISFAVQAARVGTGNVAALDTNALLIMGLDAAAAFALSQYQGYLAITDTTASNILTQAIITPSVRARSYTIAVPSLIPSLNYWILSEGIGVASRFMQENNDPLQQALKNINLNEILFGKEPVATTAITANISSFMHDVVNSENAKRALIGVGKTVFQAATIGGLLYLAGFGYADASMIESMGYATLTAVAQGTIAQIANIRHTTTPGSLISITAAPIGQQLLSIAGGTPQAAASAIIQAATTEISNVLAQEAQTGTGLTKIIQQAKSGVQSQYNSLWSSFATGWQNFKDVVKSVTTPLDEYSGIGSHEDY